MPTDIQPGAYVRVVSGMYRGAEGRVTRIDDGANGPYATVDVGGTMWPTIAVYVSALELVGAVPTVEQERDAAIAERDRLRRELEALRDEYLGLHDRLREKGCESMGSYDHHADRLDAILRGGES